MSTRTFSEAFDCPPDPVDPPIHYQLEDLVDGIPYSNLPLHMQSEYVHPQIPDWVSDSYQFQVLKNPGKPVPRSLFPKNWQNFEIVSFQTKEGRVANKDVTLNITPIHRPDLLPLCAKCDKDRCTSETPFILPYCERCYNEYITQNEQ
jgi:hypothetical protein